MIGNTEIKKSNASVDGNVKAARIEGHIQGQTVLGGAQIGSSSISGNVEVGKSSASIDGKVEVAGVEGRVQGRSILGNARVGSVVVTYTGSPYKIVYDTTANWDSQPELIPDNGTLVVYLDKYSYEKDGETVYVPGIKLADGNAYLIDLPFVTDRIENLGMIYRSDTVSGWLDNNNYIPQKNELIIYTDKYSYELDGETVYVPGFKMGDGTSYVADLPFTLDAIYDVFNKHIKNNVRHITNEERLFWNNKLNCVVDGENLTLNRL